MSLWSGKTIGNVQVGELIARGGMAEVYEGEHKTLNRKVAIKIMRDFVDGDPETRSRFEREARVIANLRHPNIIQLFDYNLLSGQPCLVMELIPGVSLGGYLKNAQKRGEKLEFNLIAQILTTIASAIDYAHSQNIVHRDIKPANILLRSKKGQVRINEPLPEDVEPVLTDFGLVRLIDSNTQTSTGTVSGTPAYMSPEQARGDKVDAKTDLYSLGVVLYEMLSGSVPFDAESSFGVLMKHMNETPPPIPHISSDLQFVIDRALAKDPALRYNSAKEMVDEFIAVFNGQTVSLNTITLNKIIKKASKQNNRPFSIALVGIGAIATILLAFLVFRPSPSATIIEEKPIGKASYLDFNNVMDKVNISFSELPPLEAGTHYEVWYLGHGGELRRKIGTISMTDTSKGELVYTAIDQKNILGQYDQLEVTIEADNDPHPTESSGDIVASSLFPPLTLIHVRHVLVAFTGAPENTALIQGLWYAALEIDDLTLQLQEAYTNKDEEVFRNLTDSLTTQLLGNVEVTHHATDTNTPVDPNAPQYPDIIESPDTVFGLLGDGSQTGYIPNVTSHVEFAMDASDATENIILHGEHVLICIENMQGWAGQLLRLTTEIQNLPFDDPSLVTKLNEMRTLSQQILSGVDSNKNEIIEPLIGEGGADTAYEHAYYMADMPLFIGINRMPPAAPTEEIP